MLPHCYTQLPSADFALDVELASRRETEGTLGDNVHGQSSTVPVTVQLFWVESRQIKDNHLRFGSR